MCKEVLENFLEKMWLKSTCGSAITIAVGVAAGANAVGCARVAASGAGYVVGEALKGAEHFGHDLDGLGALVVAALNGLAVAVLVFVLAVVHADNTGSGLFNCLLGISPSLLQRMCKRIHGRNGAVDVLIRSCPLAVQVPSVLHDFVQIIGFHCSFLRLFYCFSRHHYYTTHDGMCKDFFANFFKKSAPSLHARCTLAFCKNGILTTTNKGGIIYGLFVRPLHRCRINLT